MDKALLVLAALLAASPAAAAHRGSGRDCGGYLLDLDDRRLIYQGSDCADERSLVVPYGNQVWVEPPPRFVKPASPQSRLRHPKVPSTTGDLGPFTTSRSWR